MKIKTLVFAAVIAASLAIGGAIALAQVYGPVPTGWACFNATRCEPMPFVVGPVPTGWSRYDGDPARDGFRRIEVWRRADGAWIVREAP